MKTTAIQNKPQTAQGVTLIEVMISLVILLFVFMGLIQASLLTIESNVDNSLRDEAVRVVTDRLVQLRGEGFDSGSLSATGLAQDTEVQRSIRNMPMTFGIWKEVVDIGANTKRVRLEVRWTYRNQAYAHTINASIIR